MLENILQQLCSSLWHRSSCSPTLPYIPTPHFCFIFFPSYKNHFYLLCNSFLSGMWTTNKSQQQSNSNMFTTLSKRQELTKRLLWISHTQLLNKANVQNKWLTHPCKDNSPGSGFSWALNYFLTWFIFIRTPYLSLWQKHKSIS